MNKSHSLYNRGIDLIGAHLPCLSLAEAGQQLWTKDKRLRGVAERLGFIRGCLKVLAPPCTKDPGRRFARPAESK
jgi:hypothetical protein